VTDVVDTGPLDWRIAITDSNGRPTNEFQRRWNSQRNNNNLITTVTLGSGPPSITAPADGNSYINTASMPPSFYVASNNAWIEVGPYSFIELSDAPTTYTGKSNTLVQVNSAANGLIFESLSSVLDSLGATEGDILYRGPSGWQVLAPGTPNYVLQTNGSGAAPTWVAQSGGGGGGGPTYTPPLLSNFTQLNNPTGSTSTQLTNGVQLTAISNSGNFNANAWSQAVPTAPYTKWMRLSFSGSPNIQYCNTGMFIGDGTGKLVSWTYFAGGGSGAGEMAYELYNSITSRNSFVDNLPQSIVLPPLLGIHDDGTNFNFMLSYDGLTSFTTYSASRSAWLSTPTLIGFYANGYSQPIQANFIHWGSNLPGGI